MRDDLIGFVLGALDASEQEQIRRKVEGDERLQQQVELVRRGLQPLSWAGDDPEPPQGLADRTCQLVASRVASAGEPPKTEVVPAGAARRAWGSEAVGGERDRDWTMADFFVAAGVCVAAACLFFPALANSRWHSQLAGCQNHMRQLGTAMIDYSGGDGYFPVIPASGNGSVAGIYAPQLVERGLVRDGRLFLCPAKGSTVVLRIPHMKDVLAAKGPKLVTLHRTMGGDYAYQLGFVDRGRLQAVRNQGRSQFPILSDAPLEKVRNVSIGTHGRGQNVLFEDGHVKFLATRIRPGSNGDDLFSNDQGAVRAGLHSQDCVLAPSDVSPLPQ